MRLVAALLFCMMTQLSCGEQPSFVIADSAEGIEVKENDKPVLFYQKKIKTIDGKYERAGYIHPLYDLQGGVLTEDGPADHPYHRGIFWAWHQVRVKNKKVADGWVSEHISFQPVNAAAQQKEETVVVQSELVWKCDSVTPADVIKEKTIITIHPSKKNYRAVDFDIQLLPLVDSVALGGSQDVKGYGGFCMRFKLPADLAFQSRGKPVTAQEVAVLAGPWMDFTGSFTESKSGVAAFCTSGEMQRWILRSKTSMQNILYPGSTPVLLPKEGWRLKYRLIIHDATVGAEQLEELYTEYAAGNNPIKE